MKTNQSLTTTNFIGYAQEEYENLKPLIEITKAFVRSSNQYIYITSNPQLSSSASFLRLNVLSSLN